VTEAGPIVIVNRGFVADADRDRRRRLEPEGHPLTVVGPIRRPEVKALFTPANDPERNAWYWRDLDGMALAMLGAAGPGKVQPFFLEAEARPPADIAAEPHHPRGGATRLELPNNHLQYALTWYGLALTLVGVYAAFAWPRLAGIRKDVAGPP
jgi:surfeit locus 1 family protein